MGHHEDGIYYPSNGYPKPSLWAGTPASARYPDGAKKKKKKRKRKASKVSSNKEEVSILRGERHFNFKNPFWCDLIFSPSIIPVQKKTLSKIVEKNFLTLFGPSFSLAIYMTWVVPFLLTHDVHIFSL
jgi:hypothetical protein